MTVHIDRTSAGFIVAPTDWAHDTIAATLSWNVLAGHSLDKLLGYVPSATPADKHLHRRFQSTDLPADLTGVYGTTNRRYLPPRRPLSICYPVTADAVQEGYSVLMRVVVDATCIIRANEHDFGYSVMHAFVAHRASATESRSLEDVTRWITLPNRQSGSGAVLGANGVYRATTSAVSDETFVVQHGGGGAPIFLVGATMHAARGGIVTDFRMTARAWIWQESQPVWDPTRN